MTVSFWAGKCKVIFTVNKILYTINAGLFDSTFVFMVRKLMGISILKP